MKVLVDECVPVKLTRLLQNHTFATAQQMGWGGFKNGDLLRASEAAFDLFLTCDQNLLYQQNLRGRKITVLLLSTNHWPTLQRKIAEIQGALDGAISGGFVRLNVQ